MKKIVLLIVFATASLHVSAQYRGDPTYHDTYADYYVIGGYQYLNYPTGVYNVATIQAEMLYSFFGTRVGLAVGPDFTSFSVFGILMFAPKILLESLQGGEALVTFPIMLAAISAGYLRFPLTSHLEITLGWDAFKFTKLRNYADKFYLTGSLNAGLSFFLNDHLLLNGYYEFNHSNNWMISLVNWTFSSPEEDAVIYEKQPGVLRGHSFGFRIGWMF